MLHLPPELVISVLQHVSLSTLSSLLCASREWAQFFEVNRSTIYHNAAVFHGFIPSTSIVYSELETVLSRRALTGVNDWRSFCSAQIHIRKAWRGGASSRVTAHRCTGNEVHRIKVDEQRGFSITTSTQGGLLIVDLHEDQVLWSLPEKYVREYAHCEYGAGYLIFDRAGGNKEVWRVADDFDSSQDASMFSPPDDRQSDISTFAADMHGFPFLTRGHFKPWAVLRPPAFTRAFRFVFPTLLAATHDCLFIWGVPTGELVQVIRNIQISPDGVGSESLLGDLNYVEISARSDGHAFICGHNSLRVFSRTSGRCVLDILSSQVSYGNTVYSFVTDGGHLHDWRSNSVLKPQPIHNLIVSAATNGRRLLDEFIAVHVSACGSHIAALLASSRLIIIPFFERAISGAVDIRDIALDIQLGSPVSVGKYLAFENGRVAVATGTGLFVVELNLNARTSDSVERPPISIHRAAWFNNPVSLNCVTCLQMSDTGIFFNWDTPSENDTIREYQDDNLNPDAGYELLFSRSLTDEQQLFRLPNGDNIIQLFEPDGVRRTSMLFSIDFVPA
ncbi:hypothetical protein B0H10DRAFT_2011583 [Mycena sp. CBHHK59/15]|nr:hypothetical protein B0H10DRAFT_2011583 [Mycena sp. CBHHK59/15]